VESKRLAILYLFALLSWISDVIIEGNLHVLNLPSGAFLAPMCAIPTLLVFAGKSDGRAIKIARISLYVLLIPLAGALLPPMMDSTDSTNWNYIIGAFRAAQFVVGFALTRRAMALESSGPRG
jgi:hypothetical protein